MPIAPFGGGPNRFCGVAFTMGCGRKHPTDLGRLFELELQVPLVVGEANLADKIAGGLFLHRPIAEAEQRPMTNVAQEPGPSLFLTNGLAADVAGNDWIGPQGGGRGKIV